VSERALPLDQPEEPHRPRGPRAFTLDLVVALLLIAAASLALVPFVFLLHGAVVSIDAGLSDSSAGVALALFALMAGSFFFLYSVKYYLGTLVVLITALVLGNGHEIGQANGHGDRRGLMRFARRRAGTENVHITGEVDGTRDLHFDARYQPFVSIHIATYNEKGVIGRLLEGCAALDYRNYEVILVDDSNDDSATILKAWEDRPRFKILHRPTRDGFKGGALTVALQNMDPRAEFVIVWDADVVPFADSIQTFLPHFYKTSGTGQGYGSRIGDAKPPPELRPDVAAVQSYQWHILNKSESWLTSAVRTEYAGSYMVERPFQEAMGSLKMVAGTAFMIRADLLRKLGWGRSLTEDWQLTLRLYALGYKVVYTPYAEAPAECVGTFGRLARQRMRWAEGHSYNVRRSFGQIMRSSRVTAVEKLEFLFYTTYYLQAALFMVATIAWLIAELVLNAHVPQWTAILGWSLLFTNVLSLPLMNLAGLLLEEAPLKDFVGILGALATSFLLVPFQAYAAIKGFVERDEGGWYRTPKTGRITDPVQRLRRLEWLRRWVFGPARKRSKTPETVHAASVTRRLGRPRSRWVGGTATIALLAAFGALALLASGAPVVDAAGNPLYLHGSGTAPGCAATTLTPAIGVRGTGCEMSALAPAATWGYTNLPAQTVAAGVWRFTMDWTGGNGQANDTVSISVGASATASCAGFVATIPNGGTTWTTTFGAMGANTNSPFTMSTSASEGALVIPAGGSLCLRVTLTHNAGGPPSMVYDGTAGDGDTRVVPPSTVVPESVLGLLGLALAIPVITGRRRLLAFFKVRG
jgi:cellulose synthase/poly-beta-1,6-N-acetylglucosamine synthase-like glycosyltransferase